MKDNHKTINSVLKDYERFEKKLDLGNSRICDVPWWDCLRYQIYEELLVKLQLNGNIIFNNNRIIKKNKLKNLSFKKIINFIYLSFSSKSPIWIKKRSFIIFGHPRRIYENKVFLDKFTDPFIEIFKNKKNFSVIENPVIKNYNKFLIYHHFSPTKTEQLYHGEFFYFFSQFLTAFTHLKITKKDTAFINKIESNLKKIFGINTDLKSRIKATIRKYKIDFLIYRIFFKIKKPPKIFIVNSIGLEAMIAAAKKYGIKTYELQHGSPSRGKLNYDYSSGIKKITFPDYFLAFGKFWTQDIKLPLKKENIFNIGFPYLNKKLLGVKKIKKENILLIISQPGVISKKLIEFSIKLKKKNDDIKIIFKPHPLETILENQKYFDYLSENNITVINNKNFNLYKILKKTKYVLGVSSTVLYEALAFNCSIFVLKIHGYERLKRLISLKLVNLISNVQEFQKRTIKKKKIEDFFYSDNNKLIKSIVLKK
jgi:hypothetical protein